MRANIIDLTGKRFTRLKVIEYYGNATGRGAHWWCKCDCGKMKIIKANNLKSGMTTSCGCRRKEILRDTKPRTKYITIDGETKSVKEWCRMFQIPIGTVYRRVWEKKLNYKDAITIPYRGRLIKSE